MYKVYREIVFIGAIQLVRMICPKCRCYTFLKGSKTRCCNVRVPTFDGEVTITTREFTTTSNRKQLTQEQKKKILKKQKYKCFYCESKFGSIRHRDGEEVVLKIHFDHKMPFITSGNSYPYNFAAACHVCNAIKSDTIFETLDDARAWLAYTRKQKGYDF